VTLDLTRINLDSLSEDEKRELYELLRLRDLRAKRNRLATYAPYAKQVEFHTAGADFRERLFMAGNQLGKTWAGAYETAMHLTADTRPAGRAGASTTPSARWLAPSRPS